ncbi:AI-2E family transporter [Rhodobacterales bacterium]|nr:AI-2E family transporter [Rhodobacterales bacterium]
MTIRDETTAGRKVASSTGPFRPLLVDPVTRAAVCAIAIVVVIAGLDFAQVIFAPVILSIVVGSIFGPAANRLDRMGVPSWLSAAGMVFIFVLLILTAGAGFIVPLSDWLDKLPFIWSQLQSQLTSWQGFFSSVSDLQNEIRGAMGETGGMQVSVDDSSAVETVFYFAPTFMAQIILFLATLYFFIQIRPRLLQSALSLSDDTANRRSIRTAFKTIEERLSTYLFSITLINMCLGSAVALVMWLLGIPSPLLWGMLAFVLNYVVYIGPAVMVFLMTGVGLAIGDTAIEILTPPAAYLFLNMLEAQFVTPTVLGRAMTLNPFVVFLTISFWIWLWGPVGGFVAVPLLLVVYSIHEIFSDKGHH